MNKQLMYNTIMNKVAREVKRAINENTNLLNFDDAQFTKSNTDKVAQLDGKDAMICNNGPYVANIKIPQRHGILDLNNIDFIVVYPYGTILAYSKDELIRVINEQEQYIEYMEDEPVYDEFEDDDIELGSDNMVYNALLEDVDLWKSTLEDLLNIKEVNKWTELSGPYCNDSLIQTPIGIRLKI